MPGAGTPPQQPAPGRGAFQRATRTDRFLRNPHRSLTLVLGKAGTLAAGNDSRRLDHMNPRPSRPRLRLFAALAAALAVGAAAGAGAYALTNHSSGTASATKLVVPAQPASVHLDRRLAHAALQGRCAGRRRHHRRRAVVGQQLVAVPVRRGRRRLAEGRGRGNRLRDRLEGQHHDRRARRERRAVDQGHVPGRLDDLGDSRRQPTSRPTPP